MAERRTTWQLDDFAAAIDVPSDGEYVTMRIAGPGARLVAAIIDTFIAFVPPGVVFAALWMWFPKWFSGGAYFLFPALLAFLIFLPLVFEQFRDGQTPGKNACNIRVVNRNGMRPTGGQLWIRNLLRLVDWLPAGYLLGGLFCVVDKHHQRLGDRVAGTLVIYDDPVRKLLAESKTPLSLFSEAQDGYLLEAFVFRKEYFSAEVTLPLARQLATYFWKNYPPPEEHLREKYKAGQYIQFLTDLYSAEKEAEQESLGSEGPHMGNVESSGPESDTHKSI